MPRLSDQTRAQRRQHILASAWRCFAENGFHATSMDEVIAASGMSSSAVYRYFRSKEELIDATAEEGITRVQNIFKALLDTTPTPTPRQTVSAVVDELHGRADSPDYDLSKLVLQTWAEAARKPALRDHARTLYDASRVQMTELAARWRDEGLLAQDADPEATATALFTLMHGLIVSRHLAEDVPSDQLSRGIEALGPALGR